MAVSHHIARGFPALDIASRNGPGGAGELAFAGEEFLINHCAEKSEALAPFLDLGKFLTRHSASQEKVFRFFAEPFDHVFLGSVIVVTGRNRVAIRMASTHSLKTPSRSTIKSCVYSRPSMWTFQ